MKTIIDDMVPQLALHEGIKLTPYRDTDIPPNWTILIGYNLTSRGWDAIEAALKREIKPIGITPDRPFGTDVFPSFTKDDAVTVVRADITRLLQAVPVYYTDFNTLDDVRKRVVLDMAFNMSFRALGFKQTIAAIHARDWSRAARELYNSKWGMQVGEAKGQRCDRLAQMLLTGNAPTDIPAL